MITTHFPVHHVKILAIILAALTLTACAAGDAQFTGETPADFWWGLWHGIIAVIAFVVSLFNDSVHIYEADNTGGWYDFGFLLGLILVWSGGSHAKRKSAEQRRREQEWEEVCGKVEHKVMRKLKQWADEEDSSDPDRQEWDEIGDKVENKLKRKLREWAEKD